MEQTNSQNNGFNPEQFLEELLTKMGFQNAPEEKKEPLKESMREEMDHVIMTAVSTYLEPEVIEQVFENYNGNDSDAFFAELVANSPRSQVAIIEALNEFEEKTLDAFRQLTRR